MGQSRVLVNLTKEVLVIDKLQPASPESVKGEAKSREFLISHSRNRFDYLFEACAS